jgi:hypothetical protein
MKNSISWFKRVTALSIAAFALGGFANAQTYLPENSSDPLFGELLWHTLANQSDIALYPGKLPPRMPFELAQPDGARLIGASVREFSSRTRSVQIVLDTKLTPGEVGDFYRSKFVAPWLERPSAPYGFVYSEVPARYPNFIPLCNPQTGLRVSIVGSPKDRNERNTASYVYINFFENSRAEPTCDNPEWNLPTVLMPRDSETFDGNGDNIGDLAADLVYFEASKTDIKQLHDDFGKQLEAKGWQRLTNYEKPNEAGSVWQFSDAKTGIKGIGFLSVNSAAGRADTYAARLVALPNALD